ncbi:MAG: WYL domain-containing protein [Lachnospiraceae bacterium]|nr:WYL domain-containing protein [Lachnospiraceae bacterium]
METKGIYADRRTIYAAVSLLNTVGFEIAGVQEKGGYKYHHISKLFSASELKFLVDSVAASKFLTEKKSKELINKIKSLGSKFDGQSLNRSVLLNKRIKSMNDKVLRNLDNIYATSPYAVTLVDDRYYLIAFGGSRQELRHYRIDKMQSVKLTENKREGQSLFQSFDIVDYSRKTFGMFGGREETIMLEVKNDLAGVFIDRFGDSASIRPNFKNPDTFLVRITVHVSPQFFAWVFGLGESVKIISPETVIEEYQKMIKKVLERYVR